MARHPSGTVNLGTFACGAPATHLHLQRFGDCPVLPYSRRESTFSAADVSQAFLVVDAVQSPVPDEYWI